MTTDQQGAAGYYGQRGLQDDTSQFNVISFIVESILGQTRTMVPVKVVAIDAAAKTVDVLPLVKQIDGVGNSTSQNTVFGLPYFELRAGGNVIELTPEAGDIGIAVIADRDISAVKASKAEANPGSYRRFSLPDGVYIGGILGGSAEQSVRFTSTGIVVTDKNGNTITTGATGMNLTDVNANQIQMVAGFINFVTPVFKVNGVPVTVP